MVLQIGKKNSKEGQKESGLGEEWQAYLAPGEHCKLAAAVRESPRVTMQIIEY